MSVVMSTVKARSSKGSYYVVNFADYQDVSPFDRYRAQYMELKDVDPEGGGGGKADPEDLPF